MKTLKYSIVFFSCLLCLGANSQQRTLKLDVAYKTAMPVGNFRNLTDKASLNGWEAAIMYGLTDLVSVGFQTGFQDFYQKYDRQVFHGPGNDLSAVITNSVQLMPLLVKGAYKFTASGAVQPFVSLGVGGNLVQYTKYYGQFTDARSKFSFMAQPEAGLHMPVGHSKRAGVYIAASYNYVPFKYYDADGLNHASLKAGVSIPLR